MDAEDIRTRHVTFQLVSLLKLTYLGVIKQRELGVFNYMELSQVLT